MSEGQRSMSRARDDTVGPGAVRLVIITLGITALYLALQTVWLFLTPTMAAPFDARREAGWAREAEAVAEASRRADATLPAEWRSAAWRLGFQVGYTSHILGSFARSSPNDQANARRAMEPRLQAAQRLADAMGAGSVAVLEVTTASDYAREDDRIESDELGLARRVESRASARHRHLLLLGMHVGIAMSLAEATGGSLHNPKRPLIGYHATLAGVPPAAWEPVARPPDGSTDAEKLEAYAAAVEALDRAIGGLQPLR